MWNVATDGVENLLFDLRDGITVQNAHGVVLRLTTTTAVHVDHVQHLETFNNNNKSAADGRDKML